MKIRLTIHSCAWNDVTVMFSWECPVCHRTMDFRAWPTDTCHCDAQVTFLDVLEHEEDSYYGYCLRHRGNAPAALNGGLLTREQQDNFPFEVDADLLDVPNRLELLLDDD